MPADPRRQLIVSRMYPPTVKQLDRICVERGVERGKVVSRSELINELVKEAFETLGAKKRNGRKGRSG